MRRLLTLGVLILLAGCQQTTGTLASDPHDGKALAQAACGGCHSVEAHGLSSNPDAPEWPVIANRQGLTRETLTSWLTDAHNYPAEMDFTLHADEVTLLADYMLTLRRDDYHPPIQ